MRIDIHCHRYTTMSHAFLHHLDDVEIDAVLRDLRTRLRPGARVWIYEPAFAESGTTAARADVPALLLNRAMQAVSALIRVATGAFGMRDEPTAKKFDRLTEQAADSGWYLSPKEVPFHLEEFTQRVESNFALRERYWATIYLVGWALECNLLRSSAARRFACATFLPLAARCDRFLAARPAHLATALKAPNHGFAVWECEVRA